MEGIVEQKARTTDERLVDTFLPFVLWRPIKMLSFIGYPLTREEASAFIRFLLPPPASVVRVIKLEARDFLSPALHSPTWRRKVRRAMQCDFQEKLKRDIEKKHPMLLAARGFFAEFSAFLETSPSDRDKMVEALNSYKARDLEKRQEQLFTALVESPQAIESLFPPEKVLDPRLYKRIVIDLGREELKAGVVALLAEYLLGGKSEIEVRITRKSKIWAILGLDPDELFKGLPDPVGRRLFRLFLAFSTEGDQSQLETKLTEVMQWGIRSSLPRALLGKWYYTPPPESIEKPIGEGLTLGHVIRDARAQDAFSSVEVRLDLEIWLEELPAAQRRDAELWAEAESEGMTLEEKCRKKGASYTAARKNLERARKRRKKET